MKLSEQYTFCECPEDNKKPLNHLNTFSFILTICALVMLSGCMPTMVTYTQSPVVHGRVIDEVGNPISGARITLRGEDALQYGYTDEQGEFSLEAIEETRSVRLTSASSTRSMLLTVQVGSKKYSHSLVLFYSARGYLAPNETVLIDEKGIRSFDAIERSL
ncbi:carboxypeptidase-like regulatory domain-containing protein [uncultured Umboniibacter sp.]|uniref:carboxypeptidase-like regulatory domain-containing protein n=1 Tax=uncultured Umboniibacter sp. TaxID=1798917 RepID=UPI0026186CA1|nr:carboxypeptidase-like regulatory domain-containing protein [uncultured Umboniibacter sp.]